MITVPMKENTTEPHSKASSKRLKNPQTLLESRTSLQPHVPHRAADQVAVTEERYVDPAKQYV